ncbi:MAG: redox-sensing transcriptional repressor Rex [Acutalibacteraceae bacterium]|nr:redox-sensing transcriptional repressor Rex [Acutalibacteraceae bacterium]
MTRKKVANYKISKAVIKRLPRYYRFLNMLYDSGVTRISSGELSKRMGLTASQIRQDLNCFGGFGQQGYGYNVLLLRDQIGDILGLNAHFSAIIIGAGNLGRAIAAHMDFEKRGFNLIGIFDQKESCVGQIVRGLPVRNSNGLDEFCREYHPDIAVLCIPDEHAQKLVEQLVRLGVKGFWNFSHYDIAMQFPEIPVENVHLGDSLMTFCYKVNEAKQNNE